MTYPTNDVQGKGGQDWPQEGWLQAQLGPHPARLHWVGSLGWGVLITEP